MIDDFLRSWELFHYTYLSGWLVAGVLSLLGVLIVARDQIFLGAAVTESSTFGVALAMWIGAALGSAGSHLHENDAFLRAMAVLFSTAATLLTVRGGGAGRETREAITGWVFLVSSAGSILLVTHTPHGLEEIHRLLSSSIIGATGLDVAVFGALLPATALALLLARRPILMTVLDPATAAALGVRTALWSLGLAAWIGLSVGLALRVAGTLYTFGCLVLPALVARNACTRIAPMFAASLGAALGTSVLGFVVANHADFPPGQMTVAFLGLLLAAAWGWRSIRRRWLRT
jgi:ABC-type Mn2+/Zn2+ transport system permease subunit